MSRHPFAGPLLVFMALALPHFAKAQSPVDMAADQHHRLLLQNSRVRVFEAVLPRLADSYLDHQHSFLTVALSDNHIEMWGSGDRVRSHFLFRRGDVRFYPGGAPVGMRNDSGEEYRNVTVEFLEPGVTTYGFHHMTGQWEDGAAAVSPPADLNTSFQNTLAIGTAEATDVQLLSAASLPAPTTGVEELLIAVTALELKLGRNDLKYEAGQARWFHHRTGTLVNAGLQPARFVVVRFK